MALGKLPVPRRPTMWMIVGQGLIALAAGAGHFYSLLSFERLFESLYRAVSQREGERTEEIKNVQTSPPHLLQVQ